MRTAAPVLALLAALGSSACTAERVPTGIPTPTGPCAAARELPPDGSQEQRLQGDLDGDGRTDEVVSWLRDGERVVQAWLATGENAEPEALFSGDLLEVADVDGDQRAEVFAKSRPDGGMAFALDGCTLEAVTLEDKPWSYSLADGPLFCRGGGVLEQLRRPTLPAESAQGTLVTQSFVLESGQVRLGDQTITKTDIRADDLARADAPVLCGPPAS